MKISHNDLGLRQIINSCPSLNVVIVLLTWTSLQTNKIDFLVCFYLHFSLKNMLINNAFPYSHISIMYIYNFVNFRVCNALALLQCVASHPETRSQFLLAHVPLFLYPFLHTSSKTRPFEYLRLTSLGVIGALVKVTCHFSYSVIFWKIDGLKIFNTTFSACYLSKFILLDLCLWNILHIRNGGIINT